MPSTSQSDGKSRQSSGGKSFFSRKILRDKSGQEPQDVPDNPSIHSSTTGSQSSRHSTHTSNASNERPTSYAGDGLAMQAGVITSIPYEHMSRNTRQPINVDTLPREDKDRPQTRPEYLPHQLNKPGVDFHQYPSVEGNQASPQALSLNGPSTASKASDRGAPSIRSDRSVPPPGSSNGQGQYPFNPYATSVFSSHTMASSDQASVHSNQSPTRASSFVSQQNNSQSSFPPPSIETTPTPANPQPNSRQRQNNAWNPHHPSGLNSTASFSPDGFHLARPQDDRVVEQEFLALMHKRGWKSLPEQARRQMEAYPVSKKWTLVYQDRLAEFQGEQKKKSMVRNTYGYDAANGAVARTEEEGSPEWYVKKVMDNSITSKQLGSLSVSLRTQPIGWVKSFIEAQGQVALTNVLSKLNKRQGQGAAAPSVSEKELEREYDICKCLKALMNSKYGADDAIEHAQIVVSLTGSLTSPRLNTRRLVSEVLTFLCHWAEGQGHLKVLQAFDHLKNAQGETGRFDAWMRTVEVTIDGRGKMGSLVGASDELRSGGIGVENLLMEYAVATLFLVNMIVDAPERDLQHRCHIRAQLTRCGIHRILTKMEGFQYDIIDKQIERYRSNEAIDYEDFLDQEEQRDGFYEQEVKDLNDPNQIVEAIMSKVHGTRSQDYFLSAMQHMLLIRNNDTDDMSRMFQLVDSMLGYVSMDRRLPDMDLKQSLNFTVQNLLDKLYNDSEARQAREDALESRRIADAAIAERDNMKEKIEMGADGVVRRLQKQLEEQQAIINLQSRKVEALKSEAAETQRLRAQDLQRNELETRELYLMLRDAQDAATAVTPKVKKDGKEQESVAEAVHKQGILDREKLMDRLEMQLERAKTHAKLEGKAFQQANPSDKLRDLREQMDNETIPRPKPDEQEVKTPTQRVNSYRMVTQDAPISSSMDTTDESSEEEEEETMIYEKPRVVEMQKPRISSKSYLAELASKVRTYDSSDDDAEATVQKEETAEDDEDGDGDGITTGPSHPSFESDVPKTPEDIASTQENVQQTQEKEISTEKAAVSWEETIPKDVAPPPAPPIPGFTGGPPPPAPPLMPGFSNGAPPPAPAMPGFSDGPPPPPPPPPPPAFHQTPAMPGFTDGPAPPPPPPPPPSGTGFSSVRSSYNESDVPLSGVPPSSGAPPPPGAPLPPGAPPLPGFKQPYRTQATNGFPAGSKAGHGIVRPKKKLKALHWEKVDAPQVTMWASHTPTYESKEEKYQELSKRGILDEVEKLFMAKEIKQIGKSSSKKDDKKQIISNDLRRNFHVALAKLSQTSVEDIIRMIIHCDREILDNEVIMDFMQKNDMCEIPDNTYKLMAPYSIDWTGENATSSQREQDPAELTREDQLYLHTAFELHHYWKSRTRALILTKTFEKDYQEVSQKLRQVVEVSESLRDSVALMNILGLILDIGNYMNDSNKQAQGFKLSSLARLGMVKDDKNESTFADLVERIVRTQYPAWEGFIDEISGVIGAQKINVEQLKQDAKKYIDNINNVQMSLDSGNLSDPKSFHPEDRVSQVVQRTMKDARWKAEQMQLYLEEMSKAYEDIMTFYGEDPTDENSQRDFFPKLATFVSEWKKSKEKNIQLEETRRKNEASMKRKQQAANQVQGNGGNGDTTHSTGAMDTLLERLRAAAPQTKDQRERRRRARLKDRHDVRVASGQTIKEISAPEGDEDPGLLSPPSEAEMSSTSMEGASSEGEIIADRAASMLQGLVNDGDSAAPDPNLTVRRRRETANEERMRRRRRKAAPNESGDDQVTTASIAKELQAEDSGLDEAMPSPPSFSGEEPGTSKTLPTTTISPPSPQPTDSDGNN